MGLSNLKKEIEVIRLENDWHRGNVLYRAKSINKKKYKKRVKRIKNWLKSHLN